MRVHRLQDLPHELAVEVREAAGEPRTGLKCPACEGGRTGEYSLGLWFPDSFRAVLRCWRVGCGYLASVPLGGDVKIEPPKFKPRRYKGVLWAVNREGRERLSWYGIREGAWKFFQSTATHGDTLYMQVLSPLGGDRGGMLRRFGVAGDDYQGPKAVSYKTTDEPFQAWYIPPAAGWLHSSPKGLVIVEDQLSAVRCWQLGYAAVALLGTNLNREKWDEILHETRRWNTTPLLALDRDAFGKATKYAQRYGKLTLVILERDLKDCSDEEILQRLEG